MLTNRIALTLLTLTTLAVTSCGGDDAPEAAGTPTATGMSAMPTEAPTDTAAPTPEAMTPTAAEITVTVGPITGKLAENADGAEVLLEAYQNFETAFWNSLAAGEVSAELRSSATPEAMVGIEQAITTQENPVSGSVAVSPVLEDATLVMLGAGSPTVSEAVLTGCSDQTALRYEGDASGARSTVLAELALDADGYLVTNYRIGPESC